MGILTSFVTLAKACQGTDVSKLQSVHAQGLHDRQGGHSAGIGEEQPALISCRTGFSREDVSGYTAIVKVFAQASSRLNPVLLRQGMWSVGQALSYLKLAGTLHALHRACDA